MTKLWQTIQFWFWKIVWWWKHRTGFMDLGKDIEVTGTIVWTDFGKGPDGDFCFNVKLDPEFSWANLSFNRHTSEDNVKYPDTLHCEVPPWIRVQLEAPLNKIAAIASTVAVPNIRVRVSGRWGFDGVHTGRAEWIEILYALWRHQPNILDGWCEIHPVTKIELI